MPNPKTTKSSNSPAAPSKEDATTSAVSAGCPAAKTTGQGQLEALAFLGLIVNTENSPRYGPRRAPTKFTPGMRVEVTHGSGCASGRFGLVIPNTMAHEVNRGTDNQYREQGRYKDFDPSQEVLVRDDCDRCFAMFKHHLRELPLDASGIMGQAGRSYTAWRYADHSNMVTKDRNNYGDSTPIRVLPGTPSVWVDVVKLADLDSRARQDFTDELMLFCAKGSMNAPIRGFSIREVAPTPEHPHTWGLYATFFAKNTWLPVKGFAPQSPTGEDAVILVPDPDALRRIWGDERIAEGIQRIRGAIEIIHQNTLNLPAVQVWKGLLPNNADPAFIFADEYIPLLPEESLLDLLISDYRAHSTPEVEATVQLAKSELARRPNAPQTHPGPARVIACLKPGTGVSESVLFEAFRGGIDAALTRASVDRTITQGFNPSQYEAWGDRRDRREKAAWAAFRATLASILNLRTDGNSMDGFTYKITEPPSVFRSARSGIVWPK